MANYNLHIRPEYLWFTKIIHLSQIILGTLYFSGNSLAKFHRNLTRILHIHKYCMAKNIRIFYISELYQMVSQSRVPKRIKVNLKKLHIGCDICMRSIEVIWTLIQIRLFRSGPDLNKKNSRNPDSTKKSRISDLLLEIKS